MKKLSLSLLPHKYAVCQFHPDKHIPYWALLGDFVSLAIATYATDYLLVKEENVERALQVLEQAGHYIAR